VKQETGILTTRGNQLSGPSPTSILYLAGGKLSFDEPASNLEFRLFSLAHSGRIDRKFGLAI
jgi:hypothetical protein